MNDQCREWAVMQTLVRGEHSRADVKEGFAVRAHGTGYVVTYHVMIASVRQARLAFCHLDGVIWDRPCSFPDPEAGA